MSRKKGLPREKDCRRQSAEVGQMGKNILEVKHMTVTIYEHGEAYKVVNRISFTVGEGEIVGIVGESGCGKSMTALALQDLLKNHIKVTEGSMMFDGRDLRTISAAERRQINGSDMTMIFQEPMTSLNPLYRIGAQVGEVLMLHGHHSRSEIEERTIEALRMAGLPDPEKTMRMYPHELSGGMRQRVMIAMGIIAQPKLLIADEPTTALDVTTQAHVLELLHRINQQTGTAILLISHDLGVINKICSRVLVMYAGKIVEQGRTEDILRNPVHPYTQGLIASIPTRRMKGMPLASIPGRVPPVTEEKPPCPFASRCDKADKRCFTEYPGRKTVSDDHILWCHIG